MICIRTESSQTIGYGHLKRCLSIAAALNAQSETPVFLCAEDDAMGQALIAEHGFNLKTFPAANEYAEEILHYPEGCDRIFVDLLHVHNLKDQGKLERYMTALKAHNYTVVMIDGAFDDAYRPAAGVAPPDVLVQPYVGVQASMAAPCGQWLGGAQFAIMDAGYRNLASKAIKSQAENILVTFGGSDPQGLTPHLMNILTKGDFSNIRVTVGPYFSEEHKKAIRSLKGSFEVLENVKDMHSQYEWADMAIISSGLSRYECAAYGLPAVFAALYPSHIKSSEAFAEAGLARYIGLYSDVADGVWLKEIKDLAANQTLRATMSQKAQALIDGKGAERLSAEVLKILA